MDVCLRVARAFLGTGPRLTDPVSADEQHRLRREGLLGLYFHQLAQHPDVRPGYLQLAAGEGRMRGFLEELDRVLEQPAVAFKGAAYLGRLYGLGQRPVGDIDLVGSEVPAGFEVVTRRPLVVRKDEILLDLHEHPLGRQRAVTRWDLEQAIQRSVPLFEGARALRRFAAEDEAVIALLHGAKHAFSRLIWLVDVARLQPRGLELIRAERYAWYANYLLESLLGLPGEVGPLHPTERWILERIERRDAPEFLGMLLPLHTLPGLAPKLRYLAEALRPNEGDGWLTRIRQLLGMVAKLHVQNFRLNTPKPASVSGNNSETKL